MTAGAHSNELPDHVVRDVARLHGTPSYVYSERALTEAAERVLAFGGPFGFTARYALKANPNAAVLRLFDRLGLSFDASTVHEARRALRAGIAPDSIQLTAQMLGEGWEDLVARGVRLTACSLRQLEAFGRAFPGGRCGVRLNPGTGSGHNNRTSVAGPDASFGVWHERLPDVVATAARHDVTIEHAHHHVGSGGDPEAWAHIAGTTLGLVRALPDVTGVNLGGGFKCARVPGETETDLVAASRAVDGLIGRFAAETGRRLEVEIEPGTYLTANAGWVVGAVHDVVETGADGHVFVKVDVGMAEILRPSMYGAQHPIRFLPQAPGTDRGAPRELLVVGPCCESGDILTPAPGDPEGLRHRTLPQPEPGDLIVLGGAGAYCASMPARHYNSLPGPPELWWGEDDRLTVVRARETLDDVVRMER